MIFVETPRLLLRKVTQADYPYFRTYLTDKHMDEMMLRSPCHSEEDIQAGFDWFVNKEDRAYVIVHKEAGEVIGNLTVYDKVPPEVAQHLQFRSKQTIFFHWPVLCHVPGVAAQGLDAGSGSCRN